MSSHLNSQHDVDLVWRQTDGYVSRYVNGRVFLGARGSQKFTLDGAAAVVWLGLSEPASGHELHDAIGFALPEFEITHDSVEEALAVLLDHGLVTRHHPVTESSPATLPAS